jgi:Tfp pilus assembly PilM family ATPase/Tfp pilus assembly protein PilN
VKKKKVVLELLPGRIDVVVLDGGRSVDARRLSIDHDDDANEWAKILRRAAVSLRPLVAELKVEGCDATVLYRSPTQAVELQAFAVRSPAQAVEAATMSCTDSLPYSAMSAVVEAAVVGRDASGDAPQTHVIVVAEREDIAEAIMFLVEESGLRLAASTPLDAAVIGSFVDAELSDRSSTRGTLYVGAHASFFTVMKAGRLVFSRRIELGLESLASSLTRSINIAGRPEPVEHDLDGARAMLRKHGIPGRDDVIDEAAGLTGIHVIPLLQPVLQRFMVELRQSLRFGVDESDRENLTVRITGVGAMLKGMAELIGAELGITTERDSAFEHADDWAVPGAEPGERTTALRDRSLVERLNLLPRAVSSHRRAGRLRRWMITGTAAALLVIAGDAVRQHARIDAAQLQADVYAAQLEDLRALEATGAQLTVVLTAKKNLESTIVDEVGSAVSYRSCMHELSRITPKTIRFTSIKFSRGIDGVTGTIIGFAFDDGTGADETDLEPFIESLAASPLFANAELGNVQMGTSDARDGQRFTATFEPVAVPRYARDLGHMRVDAGKGDAP